MQSLATGLQRYLDTLDPTAAKAVRAKRNNQRFAAAVRRVWDDNPLAGEFVLAHVNSLFFAKEDIACKGKNPGSKRVLGVYLDDPAARAELNARRETLTLVLLQDGFAFDEVRIIPSMRGMRERRAFPESCELLRQAMNGDRAQLPERLACDAVKADGGPATKSADQTKQLEIFKRAVCLALGDLDHAAAFLSRIEGACLEERYANEQRRQKRLLFTCRLYTSDVAAVSTIMRTYHDPFCLKAKELGLHLVSIDVAPSPAQLKGRCAFPAQGSPIPYRNDNQTKTQ